MELKLEGRRCLVTGASAGIGAGIVEALAREGARVVATARRRDRIEALADSLATAGFPRPVAVTGDITDAAEVKRIAREAAAAVGPIEILVNSAGGSRPAPLGTGDDVWDEAFALNFTATRRITGEVLPEMRKARWGRVINITGLMEPHVGGGSAGPGRAMNAATSAKAAVHLWSKALARDIAAEGITVNCVPPGRIESEQVSRLFPEQERRAFCERHVPIGYFGTPEDMAHLVAFLASPLARYITGTVIPVDGCMSYFAH